MKTGPSTTGQDNRRFGESSNPECGWTDPDGPLTLAQSRQRCRRIARSNYENFVVASVFLPRRLRQPFFDVYAYCRTADDLADQSPDTTSALAGLEGYADQISRIYDGRAVTGIFVALSDTIRAFELPRRPFDDLLDAFRQDQSQRQYETMDDLLMYCRRSADPVGRLVLALAGALNETNARLSDLICTGLQLANFWQDVARDRDIGRVYLPQQSMRNFGVDSEMLHAERTPKPLRDLLQFQCDQTRRYFVDGAELIDRVPSWLARDLSLFVRGGLATLDAIASIDYDVLAERPIVGKATQFRLMLASMLRPQLNLVSPREADRTSVAGTDKGGGAL
ncbi:squalene synthase HpnC [Crateriforma conspicua]|uniref:All-trans-phytoene synthase n=1 Tax=Crateriforma conspicua TaxID=2527996 RepID=A0A5C5Y6F6_9PLAN|nr:squalene synthase HpnC [Crateriforma conspicua]QDV65438.1 All-trans-phytoene synthase [Crateriforma conspicua]TWT70830.1 All-trans-phytoene synthase [Crateriforma conspicua]